MPSGKIRYRSFEKANDIALVELKDKVVLKYNMWPACVVQVNPVENTKLLIAGFGSTSIENCNFKSVYIVDNI
jgi:Trypsin